jgi:hypothetical protein
VKGRLSRFEKSQNVETVLESHLCAVAFAAVMKMYFLVDSIDAPGLAFDVEWWRLMIYII